MGAKGITATICGKGYGVMTVSTQPPPQFAAYLAHYYGNELFCGKLTDEQKAKIEHEREFHGPPLEVHKGFWDLAAELAYRASPEDAAIINELIERAEEA